MTSIVQFIYCEPRLNYKVKYQINLQKDWIVSKEEKFYDFILRECPDLIGEVKSAIRSSQKFIIDVKNSIFKPFTVDKNYYKLKAEKDTKRDIFGIKKVLDDLNKKIVPNNYTINSDITDNYYGIEEYIPNEKK